jgi:hypothetical protein
LPWPEDASPARPDSAAAVTRIRHGLSNDEWHHKGATLSDKTARQEFGLALDEIYDAIDTGMV